MALLTNETLDELKLVIVALLFGEFHVPAAVEVAFTLTSELMQPYDPLAGRSNVTQLPATQLGELGADM